MDIQRRCLRLVEIGLLSFLFVMIAGLGQSPTTIALAEDDVFETLQIAKLDKMEVSDFILKSVDGEEKKLSDYKGNLIFLNFWTTW